MWVKICGNTNLEDARLAAELGADAVGFVFAPSRRQVTPEQVERITAELPSSVKRVGVFPTWDAPRIAAVTRQARLDTVQLHGGFVPHMAAELRDHLPAACRIIQVLHWATDSGEPIEEKIRRQLAEIRAEAAADRVLLDSSVGPLPGGTGIAIDWNAARDLLRREDTGVQIILAGGLRPDNIAEAIACLGPWGVDVASGVEETIGKKNPHKLAEFIERARSAEQKLKAS